MNGLLVPIVLSENYFGDRMFRSAQIIGLLGYSMVVILPQELLEKGCLYQCDTEEGGGREKRRRARLQLAFEKTAKHYLGVLPLY